MLQVRIITRLHKWEQLRIVSGAYVAASLFVSAVGGLYTQPRWLWVVYSMTRPTDASPAALISSSAPHPSVPGLKLD